MNLILLMLGCGSVCGKNEPLTAWPGPWSEVAFPQSDTAAVCRADDKELQHLSSGGESVADGVEAVESALQAAGWRPEPKADFETDMPGAEVRA